MAKDYTTIKGEIGIIAREANEGRNTAERIGMAVNDVLDYAKDINDQTTEVVQGVDQALRDTTKEIGVEFDLVKKSPVFTLTAGDDVSGSIPFSIDSKAKEISVACINGIKSTFAHVGNGKYYLLINGEDLEKKVERTSVVGDSITDIITIL